MSLTEVVTRVTLKGQQQEIERQRQEIEELRAELAWRKRSKRELEEGAARKLALEINLNRYVSTVTQISPPAGIEISPPWVIN